MIEGTIAAAQELDRFDVAERVFPVGARIRCRLWTGGYRDGVVDGHGEKNDLPVIDYKDADGEGWWCYTDQITERNGTEMRLVREYMKPEYERMI